MGQGTIDHRFARAASGGSGSALRNLRVQGAGLVEAQEGNDVRGVEQSIRRTVVAANGREPIEHHVDRDHRGYQ